MKWPPKKMCLQLNNFTQNFGFNVLWFRRRKAYKIEEKKGQKKIKKRKEKHLIAASTGWVEMKGYFKT